MTFGILFFVAALIGAALIVLALRVVSIAPRLPLLLWIGCGMLVSITALAIYLIVGYQTASWWPFTYNSVGPHALVGAAFAVVLCLALLRASGRWQAKALVGLLSAFTWLSLWGGTVFIVGCGMGFDCI